MENYQVSEFIVAPLFATPAREPAVRYRYHTWLIGIRPCPAPFQELQKLHQASEMKTSMR